MSSQRGHNFIFNHKTSEKLFWLKSVGHIIAQFFSRCKTEEEREFYLRLSIKENYSVRELDRQISAGSFERTMIGNTKLSTALREIAPDITNTFKDSYAFEFLNLPELNSETDIQKGLIKQMKNFILEFGKDFLFIEQEYKVQVDNSDFFIDLLFDHRSLQCLVTFELNLTLITVKFNFHNF